MPDPLSYKCVYAKAQIKLYKLKSYNEKGFFFYFISLVVVVVFFAIEDKEWKDMYISIACKYGRLT